MRGVPLRCPYHDCSVTQKGLFLTERAERIARFLLNKDGKLGIKGEGGSAETVCEMPSAGVSTPCFEVNPDEPEICRFHAVNAGQTANGLRFGVVSDRSCLLDKIEKENKEDGKAAIKNPRI